VYYFFGLETRGKSIEEIDKELAATAAGSSELSLTTVR
jgi:hypothetical protein